MRWETRNEVGNKVRGGKLQGTKGNKELGGNQEP